MSSPVSLYVAAPDDFFAVASFNAATVAEQLFDPNDVWDDVAQLRDYIERWRQAFTGALDKTHGIFYRVWA